MSGTFFGFNTALRGLFAQQKGLNTTAHNVANANTPGFTRQQVVLETTPAFPVPSLNRPGGVGQVGTGVDVAEVRRIRDAFLDKQIRTELGSLGKYEKEWEFLSQIETIFMEPGDTGLSSVFNEFWDAWNQLSKNAENLAIRTTVKELSITLADNFNHLAAQLETIYDDLNEVTEITVTQVNTILAKIAELNRQIENITLAGDRPNDLMDQRDLLLDDLAKIINFEYEYAVDEQGKPIGNVINIKIRDNNGNEVVLVSGNKYGKLTYKEFEDDGDNIINVYPPDYSGDINEIRKIDLSQDTYNGQLKGLENLRQYVLEYQDKLDRLAFNLALEINRIHRQGYDLEGEAGKDFFVGIDFDQIFAKEPTGLDGDEHVGFAKSIEVNMTIVDDPAKIAAAISNEKDADGLVNKGDGSNALKIYQLSRKIISGLDSTFRDYYNNLISSVGVKANTAKTNETNQKALVDQLEGRRESISGVNIDEEMANLMMYQRAYEAAARVIITLDEMIQTILGLKR